MANFKPFNNYTYFLLDKLISKYRIKGPFLDVGCGVGDLSRFLASKGWMGKAIDSSEAAYQESRKNLSIYKLVEVSKIPFSSEVNKYNSIFLWDVLEHVKDDKVFIENTHKLLSSRGFLVLSLPSNPKEWRWDDEFYGHYRRYSLKDIKDLLQSVGFECLVIWDSTYPIFWLIRRIYTFIHKNPVDNLNKKNRTKFSGLFSAWDQPAINYLVKSTLWLWQPIFWLQYFVFKHFIENGFSFLILARKK